ncbi:MAG: sulfatase-like hydrolase/transferase, partial [Treponema sp.]|nr:sulfatase-like hydrolase/transferase [Treponema sp.]
MLIWQKRSLRILGTAAIVGLTAVCGNYIPADKNPGNNPGDKPGDNPGGGQDKPDPLPDDILEKVKDYNILFITSDEHNAQMVGHERVVYPDDPYITDIKTPNIDKLADEGLYFTHAYAACPLCAPTRQSIYTSLYPLEHGQYNHQAVFPNQSTWGNYFTAQGYYTGVIGKVHNNDPSLDMGFEFPIIASGEGVADIRITPSGTGPATTVPPADKPFYDAAASLSTDGSFKGGILSDVLRDQDGLVTQYVKQFLVDNKDKKFFLHASLIAPHWPWNAPAEFYNMYDPATIRMPVSMGPPPAWDIQPTNVYNNDHWSQITEGMARVFRARYMGALSWMDDNVGQILKQLDDLGLTDKTI